MGKFIAKKLARRCHRAFAVLKQVQDAMENAPKIGSWCLSSEV
jgi:hypothetical protein